MIRELFDTEVEAVVGGKQEHVPHVNTHVNIHIKNSTIDQTNNQSLDGATLGSGSTVNFAPPTNSIG
jgi:hypothetical protein